MLPSVSIQKADGQTGVARPSDVGVLAIIAASEDGDANIASAYLRPDIARDDFGGGALVQAAAYVLPVSGNPVVLVKGTGSTPGDYGAITVDGTVTAAEGSGVPIDGYNVLISFIVGAVVGVAGATYTYSLDGGKTTSSVKSLGTLTTLVIPDTGVEVDLSGTITALDTISFQTTGPVVTNTDLVDALEALRVTSTPFECVLVDGVADATTVTTLDTWIKALAVTGRFKLAVCTCRPRAATGETEAQYKVALQAIFDASASTDVVVCADQGDVIDSIPGFATAGIRQARQVGWAVAARLMRIPIGRDAAYVNDGPVSQFRIVDDRGNPKYHDEYKHPGLDDLRLSTLRSFDGKQGSYITNANIISSAGSDYVYAQHARCINRAAELAYEVLTGQLSRGVQKNPKAGPNGERYISEVDALRIEGIVNGAIRAELSGEVDDIRFILSRTDDISSNQGAVVTGTIQTVGLAYIKKFQVAIGFVKSIGQ